MSYYQNINNFKGHDFYFILDDNARKNLMSSSFPIAKTYSDKMCCLVAVKDEKVSYEGDFSRSLLFPSYKKSSSAGLQLWLYGGTPRIRYRGLQ